MWLPGLMNIVLSVSVLLFTSPVREGSEVKWLNAACVGGVYKASVSWPGRESRQRKRGRGKDSEMLLAHSS